MSVTVQEASNQALAKLTFPKFQAKVLVFGDVMLDRYWQGPVARISPEAPVPVLQVAEVEDRLGGAANAALNIAALGNQVQLFAVTGEDDDQRCLQTMLAKQSIGHHFAASAELKTLKKLRVLSNHQQLMRMDFEQSLVSIDQSALRNEFKQQLKDAHCVVLSDYAKGTLHNIEQLIALARDAGVLCCVDPKGDDFKRYAGATILTPNRKEFEAVVGVCDDLQQMQDKALRLMQEINLQALLITLGADGMLLLQSTTATEQQAVHIPTRARQVSDVTGAGDTVVAVLAASIAEGLSFEMAARLANLAAGEVVACMGTTAITQMQLRGALRRLVQSAQGIMSQHDLLQVVSEIKQRGLRVVMTNGCFDLLHPGHIHYLEQARALGDYLIVAVNADASVQQLKGAQRPINALQQRMQVLAGLRAVDAVVAFDEQTPERLIGEVLPDILVKGGDYKVQDIAGHQAVMAHGGQVKILDFIAGSSSTQIMQKIIASAGTGPGAHPDTE